ncbi:MAG: SIR2 family protein [Opitutaceae bacterium]
MNPGDDPNLGGLKNAIQANQLVAVMGTGVSLAVGAPLVVDGFKVASWQGLIQHGIHRCQALDLITDGRADQLTKMVGWANVDDLIYVAESVTKTLREASAGTYQKWLNDTVGKLTVSEPRLIHALDRICKLLSTLNYDTLPEKVLKRVSVSWNESDQMSLAVNGQKVEAAGSDHDTVIHLHGVYQKAESVVLGSSSYRAVVSHPHTQAVLTLFGVGYTMMFVGCGETLADPNFSNFVRVVTEFLGETTKAHYVLCLEQDVEKWKAKKIPWLHPVSYGKKHADIVPFLESLAKYRGEPPSEPPKGEPPIDPAGGPTFASEWARLIKRVPPDLAAELVLLGRKTATEKLALVEKGDVAELGIQTRFPDELVTFVAGFLASRGALDTAEGARWKIVRDTKSWQKAVDETAVKNILVVHPDLDYEGSRSEFNQAATANGHAVVFGTLLSRPDTESIVRLGQPARHELVAVLKKGGVPDAKAEQLATRSNGNIPLVLRYLAGTPERPVWAKPESIEKIRPLALLGGWRSDNPADVAAVGVVVGGDYHAWISELFPILHGAEPPFVHNQNNFRPVSRYENWQLLGPYLTDAHLDRLSHAAITALRDDNPRLSVPAEKRLYSVRDDSTPRCSEILRQGLAETAALLGGQSAALLQCSPNKAREVAFSVVSSVLKDADWKRWASLGSLLTLLAEADPETYLGIIRADLNKKDGSAVRHLFGEVEGGVFGEFYHSGLLWSLEVLAWKPEYLSRVALILAELDRSPLPDNMGNRPLGSLRTTLLPWLPQTLATVAERKVAVETVLRDFPEVGWKLLLDLLPAHHGSSSPNQRPVWRDWIPPERDDGITYGERREQETIYAELALKCAIGDSTKLKKLFEHLLYLPKPAFDAIIAALKSAVVTGMPERDLLPLWQRLVQEVKRHRKYANADWAAPPEIVALLEELAATIEPKSPEVRDQFLFNFGAHDFRETDDYDAEAIRFREQRRRAITELYPRIGLNGILTFAQEVAHPFDVGIALGTVDSNEPEISLLPASLRADEKLLNLVRGFITARFEKRGLAWVHELPLASWTPADVGLFFSILPFTQLVWEAADKLLGDKAAEYWQHIEVWPHGDSAWLLQATEKLLQHDRGSSALRAINSALYQDKGVPPEVAIRAVKCFLRTFSGKRPDDLHDLREVIKFLQSVPDINVEELGAIEWELLPVLDRFSGGSAKTLEQSLATQPSFFVEVIKGCYRGKGEPAQEVPESDEKKKRFAERCYRLLRNWHSSPGSAKDRPFNPATLRQWIDEVQKLAEPTGHWEVAQSHIGNVMAYVPPDDDGLPMNRGAAAILDANDHDDMRRGYRIELFNSRGVYNVADGQADRQMQKEYEERAKKMNDAGFTNIAATLRSMAKEYGHSAARAEKSSDLDS